MANLIWTLQGGAQCGKLWVGYIGEKQPDTRCAESWCKEPVVVMVPESESSVTMAAEQCLPGEDQRSVLDPCPGARPAGHLVIEQLYADAANLVQERHGPRCQFTEEVPDVQYENESTSVLISPASRCESKLQEEHDELKRLTVGPVHQFRSKSLSHHVQRIVPSENDIILSRRLAGNWSMRETEAHYATDGVQTESCCRDTKPRDQIKAEKATKQGDVELVEEKPSDLSRKRNGAALVEVQDRLETHVQCAMIPIEEPVDQIEVPNQDANAGFEKVSVWSSVWRTVSAGLYVFNYVSNILVAKKYYTLGYSGRYQAGHMKVTGDFPTIVVILVLAHFANVVAFRTTLPQENLPLRSAYFLPLIQLRRLVSGIWITGRCLSLPSSVSIDADILYSIMGASMETGPLLILQFIFFTQCGNRWYEYQFHQQHCSSAHSQGTWCADGGSLSVRAWRPGVILQMSLVASLVSSSFNTGRAILMKSQGLTSRVCSTGIAGGVYTFSVLLLRCTTWGALLTMNTSTGDATKSNPENLGYLFITLLVPMIIYWFILKPPTMKSTTGPLFHIAKRLIHSLLFAYMSLTLGPLFALINDAKRRGNLSRSTFVTRLLLVATIYLLIDVVTLTLVMLSASSPCSSLKDGHHYIGGSPPVSATLTCTRFLVFTIMSVVLSVIPIVYLVRDSFHKFFVVDEIHPLAEEFNLVLACA